MSDEATSYTIEVTASARRQLRKLPLDLFPRIQGAIDSLAQNPRPSGVTKLAAVLHENLPLYRVRVGNYRILYSIRDEQLLVLIVSVADRKEVYR